MGNELASGTLVAGKFRVTRKLGEGAMGAVYAARHEELGVDVALKVLLPTVAKDPQFVARFLQEARAAARIEGEHIARVTDVGKLDDGVPFMVMDLLEGEDLAQLLERTGALEPGIAIAYMLQALTGLLETHETGIVHRDLKPSNLFVVHRAGRADKIKILDFGISKSGFDKAGNITTTGATMGSPAYMSPEQVRSSKNVDVRADIWSIGVITYELLTGTMPFAGESVGATFAAILETVPPPPHERQGRVPETLSAIVLRCLQRDPAARFQNASELIEAFTPFASKLSVSPAGSLTVAITGPKDGLAETVAAPETVTQHTWGDGKTAPNKRRFVWALLALGLVGVSLIAFVMARTNTAPVIATPVAPDSSSAAHAVEEVAPPIVSTATPIVLTASATTKTEPHVPVVVTQHQATHEVPTSKPAPSASTDTSRLFLRH